MTREGADALLVLTDPARMYILRGRIADLARRAGCPRCTTGESMWPAGGLMSMAKLPDIHRRAATYVDKILKGAKPADLPVEHPCSSIW